MKIPSWMEWPIGLILETSSEKRFLPRNFPTKKQWAEILIYFTIQNQ